jgi:UDPglucose 6-dehydrogenase
MDHHKQKIAVIGTGYVGLVVGACLAEFGHRVTCVDHDPERLEILRACQAPFFEPGLDGLVQANVQRERLDFAASIASAVSDCDIAFITVGTPARASEGDADLDCVFDSAAEIARSIRPGGIIVTKSTVPVGTGDQIERIARRERPGTAIHVASNPEFLREGSAIFDFTEPDRIVIGCEEKATADILAALYEPLTAKGHKLLATRRRSAELIKYASNAFLAAKVVFINEIADLCEAVDADVEDIAMGMGLDRRIGPHFLHAGPGYGGYCFPKDTLALVRTAEEYGIPLRLVEATISSNSARKRRMAQKVLRVLDRNVEGKRIAVLGLTFKPNTDDMREAPSIPVIESLQRRGADIHVFDPEGMDQARRVFKGIAYHDDAYQCAKDSDAVIIMTEWEVIEKIDLGQLAAVMKTPIMIDFRRVFSPEEAMRRGFLVETVGRAQMFPRSRGRKRPAFMIANITNRSLRRAV